MERQGFSRMVRVHARTKLKGFALKQGERSLEQLTPSPGADKSSFKMSACPLHAAPTTAGAVAGPCPCRLARS